MNQQRARRFLAVREGNIKKKMDEEAAAIGLKIAGKSKEPAEEAEEDEQKEEPKWKFDSNSITPGTAFMSRVSDWIQQFIINRVNQSPDWKDVGHHFLDYYIWSPEQLKVIFSDSSVPGEGEHKIMHYLRAQRIQPDYDPNTRHVIFGPVSNTLFWPTWSSLTSFLQDADLILLGLASHEAHLTILRENPFHNTCVVCGGLHSTGECPEAGIYYLV